MVLEIFNYSMVKETNMLFFMVSLETVVKGKDGWILKENLNDNYSKVC